MTETDRLIARINVQGVEIGNMKSEIERLNEEFGRVMYVSDLRAKRLDVCIPLITELCDVLEAIDPVEIEVRPFALLIQRAREAAR